MKKYSVSISGPDWKEAREVLFTDDGCENAGVFLCGLSETAEQKRLLARRFVPVPRHLYQDRRDYHLEVAPAFYNSIVTECEKTGLHPVIIHSHRFAGEARYSQSDNYGELGLLPVLSSLLPDRTVASLVTSHTHINGRRVVDDEFVPLESIHILTPRISVTSGLELDGDGQDAPLFDRQIRAFGREGQMLLSSLRVGIIGLGGIGSVVAEQAARIGVGQLVIIDNDRIEESNLSRVVGATRSDIGTPKADVLAKHLERLGHRRVKRIKDSAIRQDVLNQLRDCDLIFSCVDNDRTRAVLNRFAHQYLIPVIDTGVRLDARSGSIEAAAGRVSVVGEGFTCLRCSHHLNSERIRAESMPEDERARLAKEGYVIGVADPVPAVMSLNTSLAGLSVTAFLNLFVNLTGGIQPAGQIYDATSGSVFPTTPVHDHGCDVCDGALGVKGIGDGQVVSAY
jgi:molybdopterin/thiamine biosynthesis adenylyltransferase